MNYNDNHPADLSSLLRNRDALTSILLANCICFVVILLLENVICPFAGWNFGFTEYIFLNSELTSSLLKFWTYLTYSFFHEHFIHFIINVLMLGMAGRIFLRYFGDKDLLGLTILSSILGGVVYVICMTIAGCKGQLCGASAVVITMIAAPAAYTPNDEIYLTLIGRVKLKWIAIVYILISLLNVAAGQWHGQTAHLGGAICGLLFGLRFRTSGQSIVSPITSLTDKISSLCSFRQKPKIRVVYKRKNEKNTYCSEYSSKNRSESDNEILDCILDKIKKSGYDSLSQAERDFLKNV